jgi:hypothetical protein
MDPRAGLGMCRNLDPNGIRSPVRPARSESLYRPRYPGPYLADYEHKSVSFSHMFCSSLEVETLGRTETPSEES